MPSDAWMIYDGSGDLLSISFTLSLSLSLSTRTKTVEVLAKKVYIHENSSHSCQASSNDIYWEINGQIFCRSALWKLHQEAADLHTLELIWVQF